MLILTENTLLLGDAALTEVSDREESGIQQMAPLAERLLLRHRGGADPPAAVMAEGLGWRSEMGEGCPE